MNVNFNANVLILHKILALVCVEKKLRNKTITEPATSFFLNCEVKETKNNPSLEKRCQRPLIQDENNNQK